MSYIAMKTGKTNYMLGIEAQWIRRRSADLAHILTSGEDAEDRTFSVIVERSGIWYDKLYDQTPQPGYEEIHIESVLVNHG
ncbi:hypothetical protein [Paenibacillus silagei]|uniref:hypothetical protein n=1 Tax=Paenibacillus silagei TaxID=1670801 RepID=UPI001AE3B97E|nr:hypothetical protein [Paenibacillus silagei]